MDDLLDNLIQLVRANPELYDTTHEGYMRLKRKDAIWEDIAEQLKYVSGYEAKEQWKKLRDCHRDALRRQGKKEAKGESWRPWIHQRQMEFLVPYMNIMKSKDCSVAEGNDLEEDENDDDLLVAHYLENTEHENEVKTEDVSEVEEPKRKIPKFSHTSELIVKSVESLEKRTEFKRNEKKFLTENRIERFDQKPNKALYHFFMSMYHSTAALPEITQLAVRQQIFEVVTKAEEKFVMKRLM